MPAFPAFLRSGAASATAFADGLTLNFGRASGGNGTLTSTEHATKGKLFLGSAQTSWFDEAAEVLSLSNLTTAYLPFSSSGSVVPSGVYSSGSALELRQAATAAGYPSGWLAQWNASDLAGNDGDTISTWGTDIAATQGTAGARPTLKKTSNGINNLAVVRFASGKYMQTASGGASLTGDWFKAAVVRSSNVSGTIQWFLMWGDEATGKRRSGGLHNSHWEMNGYSADVNADVHGAYDVPSNNTAYFVEIKSVSGTISIYVNGVLFKTGTPSLNAYASAVLTLGANNVGTENWIGDIARLFVLGSIPSDATIHQLRRAVASDYAITIPGNLQEFNSGRIVATSQTANGTLPEHQFIVARSSTSALKNAGRFQSQDPSGYSAIYCPGHDVGLDAEGYGFATGWGNLGGSTMFVGRCYAEVYNLLSATHYPYVIAQTASGGSFRRMEVEGTSGDIVFYRRNAAYPSEAEIFRLGSGSSIITIADATNFVFNATTGTKLGTAATQKLSLWNATPVVQPTAVADADGTLASATSQLNSLLAKLRTVGMIAT